MNKYDVRQSEVRPTVYSDRVPSPKRTRGALAGIALVGAVAAGVIGLEKLDDNNRRNVSREAATEAIEQNKLVEVKQRTDIYLREGVSVRTRPVVAPDRGDPRGNELLVVGKGDVLVLTDPVVIDGKDNRQYWAATMPGGEIGYVSTEVADQVDESGNRYAIIKAPETAQDDPFEQGTDPQSVRFDLHTGEFTLDGQGDKQIATAQIMSTAEAFEDLA